MNDSMQAHPHCHAPMDATSCKSWCGDKACLGRSSKTKHIDPLPGMTAINREIAYSAVAKLRELGYEWTGHAWVR